MWSIPDEPRVVLYPGFGYQAAEFGDWTLVIRGAVLAPGEWNVGNRLMLRLLCRMMDAGQEALECEIFRPRIEAFIARGVRGRRVTVRAGEAAFPLPKRSNRIGQFSGVFRLADDSALRLAERDSHGGHWLRYETEALAGAAVEGRCRLIEPHGVSVITDIDDTIKQSDVGSPRNLLKNTFLRPFEAIDGMAELFRGWAEQGGVFHYVSSSPWQLYESLSQLCASEEFPDGPFHLRPFRLGSDVIQKVLFFRRRGKASAIRSIFRAFPRRQFVLVGDSGERDPEIYGAVARRFPQQVAAIYIRETAHRPMSFTRARQVFRRLAAGSWRVFGEADELPRELPGAEALAAV